MIWEVGGEICQMRASIETPQTAVLLCVFLGRACFAFNKDWAEGKPAVYVYLYENVHLHVNVKKIIYTYY